MVGNRLISLFEKLKENGNIQSKKDFSELLGIDYGSLNKYLTDKVNLSINDLNYQRFKKLGVNIDWLLTGEGEMFADAVPSPSQRQKNSGAVEIPLLKQTVSCGPGISWESEVNIERRLRTTEFFRLSKDTKNLFAFKAHGISMVGAGIHDGDLLIFDGSPSQEAGDDIYIFSYSGDVFCKLLRFEPIEGRIKIYSVQKEDLREADLVREIPADNEDFRIFGRVLGWIHENTVVRR